MLKTFARDEFTVIHAGSDPGRLSKFRTNVASLSIIPYIYFTNHCFCLF
jgi:di/tripeptidase